MIRCHSNIWALTLLFLAFYSTAWPFGPPSCEGLFFWLERHSWRCWLTHRSRRTTTTSTDVHCCVGSMLLALGVAAAVQKEQCSPTALLWTCREARPFVDPRCCLLDLTCNFNSNENQSIFIILNLLFYNQESWIRSCFWNLLSSPFLSSIFCNNSFLDM